MIQAGVISEEELEVFLKILDDAQRAGVFFTFGNMVLASGVKGL